MEMSFHRLEFEKIRFNHQRATENNKFQFEKEQHQKEREKEIILRLLEMRSMEDIKTFLDEFRH
jgi:hypothetical protein